MIKTQFFLYGVEVSASTAELHFMNWILALEQEANPIALKAVDGQRCALNASLAFSRCVSRSSVVPAHMMAAIDAAVVCSGLFLKDTWVV